MLCIHWKYVFDQFSGTKRVRPSLDGLDRGLGERRDAHVPLIGEPRLEHCAAAIAARHLQRVRLDLLDQAQRFEVGDDALARHETIEPAILLPALRR